MRVTVSLAFALAAVVLAVALVPRGLTGASDPQGAVAGSVDTVAVDMDIGGNLPNGPLGPTEDCRQIAPGGTLTFDVIIDSVHPEDGLSGYQLALTYDPAIFHVAQAQGALMLSAMPGSNVQLDHDSLPDSDGVFNVSAFDPSLTAQESGQGVLTRITLINVGSGESEVQFANATITGGNNQPIPIGNPPRKGKGGSTTCVPTPSPSPTPTPSPTPSPSPTASPNPFTHPVPPGRTAPSAGVKEIYGQKLARLREHSHQFPISVADALKSLSEPVTIEFDCPKPPGKVSKVVIKITTTIVAWDPKAAVPGSAGTYQWNVKTDITNDVKTWTANNWLMMDPAVMAAQEASPPFGPVVDEALLYHELMHGQLQMDYMKTQAFKDAACMCKWTEQGEAHEHDVIRGAVNGYLGARFPGATVDIVKGKTKVGEDGSFEMDLGPANKDEWTYVVQDPEGGSNMSEVEVVVENGRFVLKGKLADKNKPGKILVIIDPPSYYLIGGFDEFLIVYPEGDSASWGDLDCDGDSDSADAFLVILHFAGLEGAVPSGGCPSLGEDVYIDGLERPWGDLDCSRDVTLRDALIALQSEAGADIFAVYDCPAFNDEVTMSMP